MNLNEDGSRNLYALSLLVEYPSKKSLFLSCDYRWCETLEELETWARECHEFYTRDQYKIRDRLLTLINPDDNKNHIKGGDANG